MFFADLWISGPGRSSLRRSPEDASWPHGRSWTSLRAQSFLTSDNVSHLVADLDLVRLEHAGTRRLFFLFHVSAGFSCTSSHESGH